MVDVVLLAKVLLIGALTAAAVQWLSTRGAPRPWRCASWSWAIGAGLIVASGITDQWPGWPPLEDRARFLALLVPLTLALETLAATIPPGRTAWLVRLNAAAVTAPLLLHNTVYLADHDGPNSAEWPPSLATLILCGLAVTLSLLWIALAKLEARTSTATVMGLLLLDALAAAVSVMLSGYFRAGLVGLGLTGAIAGALLVAAFLSPRASNDGTLGMAVIGIFSLVLMGRFFGSLSTDLAAALLFAPLLAWTTELPPLRKLSPSLRSAARLACVAIPLVVVIVVARQRFAASSNAPSNPRLLIESKQSLRW